MYYPNNFFRPLIPKVKKQKNWYKIYKDNLKFLNEMKEGELYLCSELAKRFDFTVSGLINSLKKNNLPIIKERHRKMQWMMANYITKKTFFKLIRKSKKLKRYIDYMKKYVSEMEDKGIEPDELEPIVNSSEQCTHLLSLPDEYGYRTCLYCGQKFLLDSKTPEFVFIVRNIKKRVN